jgi:hypothetical protein
MYSKRIVLTLNLHFSTVIFISTHIKNTQTHEVKHTVLATVSVINIGHRHVVCIYLCVCVYVCVCGYVC